MSIRRYVHMEVVGDPMLIPVLVEVDSAPPFRPFPYIPQKADPMPDVAPSAPLCPQCRQPIVTPVSRTIISRGRDPVTRKAKVVETRMVFCSEQCGLHCQYAHEG